MCRLMSIRNAADDGGVGAVCCSTVMCEHGVQQRAEHTSLGGISA